MNTILNLPIGQSIDWKFGIVTRDVYRISENKFELTETCGGTWYNATVSKEKMRKLLTGQLSLTELKWN